jgi:SH3 domain-containing YSC84-like protein 1
MSIRSQGRAAAFAAALVAIASGVVAGVSAQAERIQERTAEDPNHEAKRVSDATAVVQQVLAAEEPGIPRAVLEKAVAIAVLPHMQHVPGVRGQGPVTRRLAFMQGIRARGILSVRDEGGRWSAPVFVTLNGGSPPPGDVVLLVLERSAVERLLGNAFTFDSAVVAGPTVTEGKTTVDVPAGAAVLSYSRSRGTLTGVSLDSRMVQHDPDATKRFYGKALKPADAIAEATAPEPAPAWRAALEKHAR